MRRVLRQVMTGLVSISAPCAGVAVITTAAETSVRAAASVPCAAAAAQRHRSSTSSTLLGAVYIYC